MSLADKLHDATEGPGPSWKRRPGVLCLPNIPMPMTGVAPRVVLGKEWWDATRRAAYLSTAFHCVACGVYKYEAVEYRWLEGHELYEVDYLRGRMTYVETVPLCHYCHNYIHDGRMRGMVAAKEMTKAKYRAVIRHGNKVLADAGLDLPPPYVGVSAAWSDWRLVLFGREYPPLYKTFKDWDEEFGKRSPRRKRGRGLRGGIGDD